MNEPLSRVQVEQIRAAIEALGKAPEITVGERIAWMTVLHAASPASLLKLQRLLKL